MAKLPDDLRPQPLPVSSDRSTRAALREIWARTALHPYRNFLIVSLLVTAVATLGICLMYVTPMHAVRIPTELLLREATGALDQGQFELARNLAADLRLRTDIPEADLGIPAYVLGAVMYHDALAEWRDREAYFLMAARYLEESQRSGFPAGREGAAALLLGQALHGCGRFAESMTPLQAALEREPGKRTEICKLLADASLRNKSPNWERAAAFNQQYLEDPSLSREDREAALLTQARISFELGRFEDCRRQLDPFRPDSAGYAEVLLLRGRLLFQAEKFSEAREQFAQAQQRGQRDSAVIRQAQYLQGLCLRRLGDPLAAQTFFARNGRSFLDTAEGMASGIEESELHQQLGNSLESLASYQRVLRQIAATPTRVQPLLTDDALQQRLEAAATEFRKKLQFQFAADLLQAMSLVFPDARTAEQQAMMHQEWGDSLMKQAASPQAVDSVALRTESRQKYRQAGVDFGRLAQLRFATREYPNDLWRSAEEHLRGQDYDSAVRAYLKHLEVQNRNGRPPALTRLGECLLALNRPEEALRFLNECIEFFPKDPFVYRARLIAAEADLELGRDDQAKSLLTASLENESLTPQSREWRQSLMLLGKMYYFEGLRHQTASQQSGLGSITSVSTQQGMKAREAARTAFQECITRLGEAVERERDAEQSLEARYMLALAHLHSAKVPKVQLVNVNIESTRGTLRRELQRELRAAIAELDRLRTILVTRQERNELSPVEKQMFRNCYFQKADALFDLDQYDEAIDAYSSATNRYQQEPESLEAYVQIAVCQRKLNRLADARRTLEQAKHELGRMPATAVCEKTTRYDRQEWSDLLGWMSKL